MYDGSRNGGPLSLPLTEEAWPLVGHFCQPQVCEQLESVGAVNRDACEALREQ